MTIPHSTDLDISTSFTVEAWVNRDDNGEGYIISKASGTSGAYGWFLQFHNNSSWGYTFQTYNTSNSTGSARATIAKSGTAGKWQHVVGTYDGTNTKIYVDGELKGTTALSGTVAANTAQVVLGAYYNYGAKFDGKIAQVRVYQTALSSSEVKTNYDATKGLYQYPGLELHLDAGDDSTVSTSTWTDLTANDNDGTLNSFSSTLSDFYEKELGNYISFDGSNDFISIPHDASLDIGSNGITVECWFKNENTTGTSTIFGKMGTVLASLDAFYFRIQANKMKYVAYSNGSIVLNQTGGTDIGTKWRHVVATVSSNTSGSAAKLYIDGEIEIDSTLSGNYDGSTERVAIGRFDYAPSTRYFDGDIGQFRIYSGALTADQVIQNYRFTKNDYPNAVNFSNAGDRANWLSEGSWNFDAGANEYFSNNYTNGSPGMFQHRTGTGNFAISAWVKPDNVTASWRVIIGCQGYSSDGWQLYANQDDIRFWGSNGTNYELVTLNGVLTANTWTHVVVQRTNTTWEGYIDGSSSTNSATNKTQHLTDPMGNDHATNSNLIIGRDWTANQYQWDGRISDIKIFNKALTAAEVTAEYNKGQFGDK